MSNPTLKFVKVGLPFFAIVFGSAFGLHYFQQVRYDFSRVKKEAVAVESLRDSLAEAGLKVKKNVTIEDVYQEVSELDTDNWENIRGPREFEDNSQYEKAKKDQQEEARARRRALQPNSTPSPEPRRAPQHPEFDPLPGPSRQFPRAPGLEDLVPDPGDSTDRRVDLSGIAEIPNEPSAPTRNLERTPQSQTPRQPVQVLGSTPSDPLDPAEDLVDQALLDRILEFGYDEYTTRLAIKRTRGVSAEAAVNWILDHSNQSDYEASIDESSEDEDVEMGVSGSALAAPFRPGRTHKMVFVANMSLKMGAGKMAAQVGHACLGVYRTAVKSEEGQQALEAWRRHGEVKIVVKGQSTEQLMDMFKAAKDLGLFAYLVQDAGYTQIPPGSRTVLGLFGPVEMIDQITGSLKLM
ncbi:hypothetical protein FO519_003791 [Halicephalobus sp. NKZ332]|nr:hypothetical protein FO519_003791 [Halicephalobus sp. NKZ332]